MVAITGGAPSVVPTGEADIAAPPGTGVPTEDRIAAAMLVCIGRWGLTKTTIGDIAREAGVSRATVYRLYPGGKSAISEAAAVADVQRLVDVLREGLVGLDAREEFLSRALELAASFFDQHEALNFLRQHEPIEFQRLVHLDRLETLLIATGELVGPVLRPVFDTDAQARAAAIWLGRLVASHVVDPSPSLLLADATQARVVVTTFVLPGLAPMTARPEPATTG